MFAESLKQCIPRDGEMISSTTDVNRSSGVRVTLIMEFKNFHASCLLENLGQPTAAAVGKSLERPPPLWPSDSSRAKNLSNEHEHKCIVICEMIRCTRNLLGLVSLRNLDDSMLLSRA